ncbi:MAG: bifunctional O-acetylhomoserine aminocarboxypropyltransferase/cysteine synthase, partial [Candidatus Omnitrophica bacterium]|nr:bifunctional O-acetylhomoserine aminocarboxypropyltransferase/cysteine synthase [Candidatus Omnitrophota bacterium]
MNKRKWDKGTLGIHAGYSPEPTTGAKAVPIYQSASFVFKDTREAADLFALKKFGNIYTRLMNPTTDALEKRLAALDGGTAAVAASSGMSAITLTVLALASAGDEVVAASSLYGGTFTLLHYTLRKLGINTVFVDPADTEGFRRAITPRTKFVYAETIGNPRLDPVDISAVADIAHDNDIPLVIDNTIAPFLVSPVDSGADIVVYS